MSAACRVLAALRAMLLFGILLGVSAVGAQSLQEMLTLNVIGAQPGDYVVEYKLRDISGDKTTSFELPFKIAS